MRSADQADKDNCCPAVPPPLPPTKTNNIIIRVDDHLRNFAASHGHYVTIANPESRADVRLEAFSFARLKYSFLHDSACNECSFRLIALVGLNGRRRPGNNVCISSIHDQRECTCQMCDTKPLELRIRVLLCYVNCSFHPPAVRLNVDRVDNCTLDYPQVPATPEHPLLLTGYG